LGLFFIDRLAKVSKAACNQKVLKRNFWEKVRFFRTKMNMPNHGMVEQATFGR
jgi:hypothetical protein